MMHTKALSVLAFGIAAASSCTLIDDDQPTTNDTPDTDGNDAQACYDAFQELLQDGCPPGSYPQVHYDGGSSTVVELDDPGVAVSLGLGLLVEFGAGTGADWVGYKITQNGDCTLGCFVAGCAFGQYGCYATNADGEMCAYWCDAVENTEACTELSAVCLGSGVGTGGGGTEDTGIDDGGLDETGSSPAQYDCTGWHPEWVQPSGGHRYLVPQALVDVLVLADAEPLSECDGTRLRPGSEGYWRVSKLDEDGVLARLGLEVGDELRTLDDVNLRSLDGLLMAASKFMSEDGSPRTFPAAHPGFVLRVRRGHDDIAIRFRVAADAAGGE